MKSQNIAEIEKMIWSYLDHECSEAEAMEVSMLLKTDDIWKVKYLEIFELHQTLAEKTELQEPSMRFAKDIMEIVEKEKIVHPVKTYLNRWVIGGIIAFFVVNVSGIIINLLSSQDAAKGGNSIITH